MYLFHQFLNHFPVAFRLGFGLDQAFLQESEFFRRGQILLRAGGRCVLAVKAGMVAAFHGQQGLKAGVGELAVAAFYLADEASADTEKFGKIFLPHSVRYSECLNVCHLTSSIPGGHLHSAGSCRLRLHA